MKLSATNLSQSFDVSLYKGVNLSFNAGESCAILGVSGSGKSSLLNNLSTMLKPTSGKINIGQHQDIYSLSSDELIELRRKTIGIIFQSHYLFRGFSALENLQTACVISGEPMDMELIESFGIKDILHQDIATLSGGQQQRVSIVRVLLKRPSIIIADEPTGNLDSKTAVNVVDIILDYVKARGAILVLATHDREIAKMCKMQLTLANNMLLGS